jgi:glycosyltransferase involved in cell wall biosynthesis
MRRFGGRIRLRLIGREAPGARGYVRHLLESARVSDGAELVEYAGELPRADLVTAAAGAQVGLALVPRQPSDINMRHMTGASNKAFDYMAAGLALLVSDLPDWREMFVAPGYARACDPGDADSVAQALTWFLDHPEERRVMAARGRAKIETEWNYETGFASAMQALDACLEKRDWGEDV